MSYERVVSIVMPFLPIYTLFPYTTLFRSPRAGSAGRTVGGAADDLRELCAQLPWPERLGEVLIRTGLETGAEDRKSTRLNSSHVAISYAVLCLKKNININQLSITSSHTHC